jgi:ketosteroid isomerase-like protein
MRIVITAVLAAAALAACGGGEREPPAQAPKATAADPDEQAVRATLERYAAAVRAGDAELICKQLMSRAVLAKIDALGGDCARDFIADRVREGGPNFRLTVRSVSIQGNRAMTRGEAVESDGPRSSPQPLVREQGGWRLTTEAP